MFKRNELREQVTLETLNVSAAEEQALDVEGMLAFAEHTLTHAGALWAAETCTARRVALQCTLFPTGIQTSKNGVIETPLTCLEFFELTPRSLEEKGLVDLTGIEPVTSECHSPLVAWQGWRRTGRTEDTTL